MSYEVIVDEAEGRINYRTYPTVPGKFAVVYARSRFYNIRVFKVKKP